MSDLLHAHRHLPWFYCKALPEPLNENVLHNLTRLDELNMCAPVLMHEDVEVLYPSNSKSFIREVIIDLN